MCTFESNCKEYIALTIAIWQLTWQVFYNRSKKNISTVFLSFFLFPFWYFKVFKMEICDCLCKIQILFQSVLDLRNYILKPSALSKCTAPATTQQQQQKKKYVKYKQAHWIPMRNIKRKYTIILRYILLHSMLLLLLFMQKVFSGCNFCSIFFIFLLNLLIVAINRKISLYHRHTHNASILYAV